MTSFWGAAVNLFVRAVPAHLMAYYPFRDRLRFPLWKVLLPVGLIQITQSLLYGYLIVRGDSGHSVEYGIALLYMAIYFFSVKDDHHKLLFLYLFVMDYVMILRGIAAFLEAWFCPRSDMDFISWTSTTLCFAVLVVSAPFMMRFLTNAREKVFRTHAPAFWRIAWLLPAFTTGIVLLFTGVFSPELACSFQFLFSRVLLLLSVFVVYTILLNAIDGIRRQAALEEQAMMQENLLNLQQTQQKQLLKYMKNVKAARHDLRQHLNVIEGMLDNGDTERLKQYLKDYSRQLPADVRKTFCKNTALNAVCTYYAEEARKQKIDYVVNMDFPECLPVSEPEVCALLGNLLENAVEACSGLDDAAPFINVNGMCTENYIVLTVDNTCVNAPVQENGRFRSAKHEGYGTGTWSVRNSAERHDGNAEFRYQDGVFFASVFLYG